MDTRNFKPLLSALDAGYRYRPPEMLRFFLSSIRTLWGLPAWEEVPEGAQEQVSEAIEAYSKLVFSSAPFLDILGPIYMELGSHGARSELGQFFTPYPIASMMAQMIAGDLAEKEGLITTCDPACGSGVMLLAFADNVLMTHGPEVLQRISLTGIDLDYYCAHMAAIQLVANCNIHRLQLGEILVLQGNSLGPLDDLKVILHATIPSLNKLPPALAPERLSAIRNAVNADPEVDNTETVG